MAQHAFIAGARPSSPFGISFCLPFDWNCYLSLAVGGFLVFPLGFLGDLFDGSLHIAGPSNLVVSSGLKEMRLVDVVSRSGCPVSHLSLDASCAVITGYCTS